MIFFLIAVIAFLILWDAAWWLFGVRHRFPWQLQMGSGTAPDDLLLVDVRTRLEYNWFHLPGAQNLPELLTDSSKLDSVPPSREMVVICMTGHRSPLVAYALKKQGHTRVSHLAGGMLGWKIYDWVSRWQGRRRPPQTRGPG